MFSLKKTIDKLDRDEQRFHTTLDCYLAAISGIHDHVVDVSPELTRAHVLSLQALHDDLRESPSDQELIQSRAALLNALADYQCKSAACLSKKEENLRAILTSLAEAAETFNGHNEQHSEGLKKFTDQLQIVARGNDLSQMRRELAKQVAELRVMRDELTRSSSGLVADMRKQLAEFQERLEHSERRAVTDSLTGLLNRGEGEERLVAQLEGGQPLFVILVDLDDFKQINDRFGHGSGDQVLKTFGHVLTHNIRPSDTVCRWGGDEFMFIIKGNERIAEQRAIQLRERLKIRCALVVLGKMYDVDVRASLGVAQARAGETMQDLLARADRELYRHKHERKERSEISV